MILILFSAPCVYDPTTRGFAEAHIAYTGDDPRATAEKYIRQITGARLYAVVCNGRVVL